MPVKERLARRAGILLGTAVLGLGLVVSPPAVAATLEELKAAFRRPAAIPHPASNPWSEPKERLGRALFFDTLLSGARVRSCATCHNPGLSWGDGLPRAIGEGQMALAYRSPTILNIAWVEAFGWDGKFPDLESVAFTPITAKGNMNVDAPTLVQRLQGIAGYRALFAEAFPGESISRRTVELALGVFQRTIVSGTAPFDRWIAGQPDAIADEAQRGFALFTGKARCSACHSGWNFTDDSFRDIGVAGEDRGRGRLFPNAVKLQHAFKTPTLRNVAVRYPYMHDGSVATLREVIDLYDRGGIDRPSRADEVRPLGLTAREKDDLIAFLETLTGNDPPVAAPPLPR